MLKKTHQSGSKSLSKEPLNKKIVNVFYRLTSSSKSPNRSIKLFQSPSVQHINSNKKIISSKNTYLKHIKSSEHIKGTGLKKRVKITVNYNENRFGNKQKQSLNAVYIQQFTPGIQKIDHKLQSIQKSKTKSRLSQDQHQFQNSTKLIKLPHQISNKSKLNSTQNKTRKVSEKIKNIKIEQKQFNNWKNNNKIKKKVKMSLSHSKDNQTSICIQHNPQIEKTIIDKQKLLQTEASPSWLSLSNKSNLNNKLMKLVNVVDLKVQVQNKTQQIRTENKQISQLNQQVYKYQNRCKQLENQLRQTLQTVKYMSKQLSIINKKTQQDSAQANNDQNINQGHVVNSLPVKYQNLYLKSQVKYNITNDNSGLVRQQVKNQSCKQIKHEQTNVTPKSTNYSYPQNTNQSEKKQKVLYTINPVIISSSSPRVIRLGRDRSYCTKGCTSYCTCLCPSLSANIQN